MKTKKCTKCQKEKTSGEFAKHKLTKDGLQSQCRNCQKEYTKQHRIENPNYDKEYREKNKEKLEIKRIEWKENNPNYLKEWRDKNPNKGREYYKENKEKQFDYNKKFKQNNPTYQKNYIKGWKETNPNYMNKYHKIRSKYDPIFKLRRNISSNIGQSFKRACNGLYTKKSKSLNILGCDINFFIEHITSQFKEGMTLKNYGEWHLDHIIPISSAQTEEDIVKLCHYSNYQPLWAEDNFKKSNKILGD